MLSLQGKKATSHVPLKITYILVFLMLLGLQVLGASAFSSDVSAGASAISSVDVHQRRSGSRPQVMISKKLVQACLPEHAACDYYDDHCCAGLRCAINEPPHPTSCVPLKCWDEHYNRVC